MKSSTIDDEAKISEDIYYWLDRNGGVFCEEVMQKIGATDPPENFVSSAELFSYIHAKGVDAVKNGTLSYEELTKED